jgi:hypothetical protein
VTALERLLAECEEREPRLVAIARVLVWACGLEHDAKPTARTAECPICLALAEAERIAEGE